MSGGTPRLGPPDPASYSPEQAAVARAIASGPRGGVRGPLAVWLHRPELAGRAQALGEYCRYGSALDPRLSELAILVTAREWGSEYEWHAHKAHGLKAGLDPAVIEAIRVRAPPPAMDDEARAVFDVSTALYRDRRLNDALYGRAAAVLGEARLVDLVGVLGYYALISMTINVFEVGLPDGVGAELQV